MKDYTKCELQGLDGICTLFVGHYTYKDMLYLIVIVECIHVESATASIKDLALLHRRTPLTKQQIFV